VIGRPRRADREDVPRNERGLRQSAKLDAVSTRSRVGNVGRIFDAGRSELLNEIARLSIFYEDLRLEMLALRELHAKATELNTDLAYQVMYYMRRGLATLEEFRSGLACVRRLAEFKSAERRWMTKLDATLVVDADRHFQKHAREIKALRNEFAGHIGINSVRVGLENFADLPGGISWTTGVDGWTMGLECEFAGAVLASVISANLQNGSNVRDELRRANEIMMTGFHHAQASMCALAHAFLWDHFGR